MDGMRVVVGVADWRLCLFCCSCSCGGPICEAPDWTRMAAAIQLPHYLMVMLFSMPRSSNPPPPGHQPFGGVQRLWRIV